MFFSSINKGVEEFRQTSGAVLVDVREPREFRAGHIPGAVNVPLDQIEDLEVPLETPIFIYCLWGSRSVQAGKLLEEIGYENVRSIGGIAGYKGEKVKGEE